MRNCLPALQFESRIEMIAKFLVMNSRSPHFHIRGQVAGLALNQGGVRIMSGETVGTSPIRNYLLGNLSQPEAEEIERSYFADGQKVDEIWVEFGAIAEEYLCADLSETESRQFEQRLKLLPALRQMFENEKALFDYSARITKSASRQVEPGKSIESAARWKWRLPAVLFKPSQLMTVGAIALVALVAGITWFALRTRDDSKSFSGNQPQNGAQQAGAKTQKSTESLAQPSVDPQQPQKSQRDSKDQMVGGRDLSTTQPHKRNSASGQDLTPTFLLLATGTRGGQSDQILEIPARTVNVRLELELTNENCSNFSAALYTESNEELQRWENLKVGTAASSLRVVSLRFRADILKNAGYLIKLGCVPHQKNPISAGQYSFKLEKK